MTPPEPEQFADGYTRGALPTLLLDKAVHVTYAIDQLHRLAASDPHDDPAASQQLAEAIAIMTNVRTTLICTADRLTQAPDHPRTNTAGLPTPQLRRSKDS